MRGRLRRRSRFFPNAEAAAPGAGAAADEERAAGTRLLFAVAALIADGHGHRPRPRQGGSAKAGLPPAVKQAAHSRHIVFAQGACISPPPGRRPVMAHGFINSLF